MTTAGVACSKACTSSIAVQTDNPVDYGCDLPNTLSASNDVVGTSIIKSQQIGQVHSKFSPSESARRYGERQQRYNYKWRYSGATASYTGDTNDQSNHHQICWCSVPKTLISHAQIRNLHELSHVMSDAILFACQGSCPQEICNLIISYSIVPDFGELWLKQRILFLIDNISNIVNIGKASNLDLSQVCYLIALFAGGYGFDPHMVRVRKLGKIDKNMSQVGLSYPLQSHSARAVYHTSVTDLETHISDAPMKGDIWDPERQHFIYYSEISVIGKNDEMWIGMVAYNTQRREDILFPMQLESNENDQKTGSDSETYKIDHLTCADLTQDFINVKGSHIRIFPGSISYYGGRRSSIHSRYRCQSSFMACMDKLNYPSTWQASLSKIKQFEAFETKVLSDLQMYMQLKQDSQHSQQTDAVVADEQSIFATSLAPKALDEKIDEIKNIGVKTNGARAVVHVNEVNEEIDRQKEALDREMYFIKEKNMQSKACQTCVNTVHAHWRAGMEYNRFEEKRLGLQRMLDMYDNRVNARFDGPVGCIAGDANHVFYVNSKALPFYETGDKIGIWFDEDGKELRFYRNGKLVKVLDRIPELRGHGQYYLLVTTDKNGDCLALDRKHSLINLS